MKPPGTHTPKINRPETSGIHRIHKSPPINTTENRKIPPEEKTIFERKNQNTTKPMIPLVPAQKKKKKHHYNIEQNHYKKISCLDMVEQTAKNGRNLDDLPLRKLSAD